MVEFIVEEAPIKESDTQWAIVGRCSTDVCKGSRFNMAIPYSSKYDKTINSYIQTKLHGFPVLLTVEKILSWEKEWDIINAGMAAKLIVSGDASKIVSSTFLVDEDI